MSNNTNTQNYINDMDIVGFIEHYNFTPFDRIIVDYAIKNNQPLLLTILIKKI